MPRRVRSSTAGGGDRQAVAARAVSCTVGKVRDEYALELIAPPGPKLTPTVQFTGIIWWEWQNYILTLWLRSTKRPHDDGS